jgi:hypothetical protein
MYYIFSLTQIHVSILCLKYNALYRGAIPKKTDKLHVKVEGKDNTSVTLLISVK